MVIRQNQKSYWNKYGCGAYIATDRLKTETKQAETKLRGLNLSKAFYFARSCVLFSIENQSHVLLVDNILEELCFLFALHVKSYKLSFCFLQHNFFGTPISISLGTVC